MDSFDDELHWFLGELRLTQYYPRARDWCRDMGAGFLHEIATEELANFLQLRPLERRRFLSAGKELCEIAADDDAEPSGEQSRELLAETKKGCVPSSYEPPPPASSTQQRQATVDVVVQKAIAARTGGISPRRRATTDQTPDDEGTDLSLAQKFSQHLRLDNHYNADGSAAGAALSSRPSAEPSANRYSDQFDRPGSLYENAHGVLRQPQEPPQVNLNLTGVRKRTGSSCHAEDLAYRDAYLSPGRGHSERREGATPTSRHSISSSSRSFSPRNQSLLGVKNTSSSGAGGAPVFPIKPKRVRTNWARPYYLRPQNAQRPGDRDRREDYTGGTARSVAGDDRSSSFRAHYPMIAKHNELNRTAENVAAAFVESDETPSRLLKKKFTNANAAGDLDQEQLAELGIAEDDLVCTWCRRSTKTGIAVPTATDPDDRSYAPSGAAYSEPLPWHQVRLKPGDFVRDEETEAVYCKACWSGPTGATGGAEDDSWSSASCFDHANLTDNSSTTFFTTTTTDNTSGANGKRFYSQYYDADQQMNKENIDVEIIVSQNLEALFRKYQPESAFDLMQVATREFSCSQLQHMLRTLGDEELIDICLRKLHT
ncbi:unnamed protein product [Amoebophrya sp. A120]|nr:unnamed protein product [Amoebophrya sp. A120]|eukprot:GSA120T00016739001.1